MQMALEGACSRGWVDGALLPCGWVGGWVFGGGGGVSSRPSLKQGVVCIARARWCVHRNRQQRAEPAKESCQAAYPLGSPAASHSNPLTTHATTCPPHVSPVTLRPFHAPMPPPALPPTCVMNMANSPAASATAKAAKLRAATKPTTMSAQPTAVPPAHTSSALRSELPTRSSSTPPASVPKIPAWEWHCVGGWVGGDAETGERGSRVQLAAASQSATEVWYQGLAVAIDISKVALAALPPSPHHTTHIHSVPASLSHTHLSPL